ncbi:YnbE family lipoprotein [Sphingomonas sp.]|jgi:hypothetical protein|uniref:YnbE family lipoprotein n=1 Tax=Sphingomonas sp. TaxID=28214 RepID=UPI003D6D7C1D
MTDAVIWKRSRTMTLGVMALSGLAGCVNVSAPDKPIVINLNINVKQEVVYRLDGEAKTTIQANPGIF